MALKKSANFFILVSLVKSFLVTSSYRFLKKQANISFTYIFTALSTNSICFLNIFFFFFVCSPFSPIAADSAASWISYTVDSTTFQYNGWGGRGREPLQSFRDGIFSPYKDSTLSRTFQYNGWEGGPSPELQRRNFQFLLASNLNRVVSKSTL